MKDFLLGFLCLFAILSLYVLIRIIIDLTRHHYCYSLFAITIQYFRKNLAYNIGVTGSIRKGKNALTSGLNMVLSIIHSEDIEAARQKLEDVLIEIDYQKLDEEIQEEFNYLNENERYSYESIFMILYPRYKEILTKYQGYNDHLRIHNLTEMFKDYIEATIRKLENNFTASNYKLLDRITGNISYPLEYNAFNIKDEYILKSFKFRRYCTHIIDEASLFNSLSTDFQSISKADTGSKEFLRLEGQIFKETSHTIFILQNFSRLVKENRELFSPIIRTYGLKVIGEYKFINSIIRFFMKINNAKAIIHSKFIKDPEKRLHYLRSNNKYKKRNLKWLDKLNQNFANTFLEFDTRIFEDATAYESASAESPIKDEKKEKKFLKKREKRKDDFNTIFPTSFCFGTYLTHYYSFIYEMMEKNSFNEIAQALILLDANKASELEQSYSSQVALFNQVIKKRKSSEEKENISEENTSEKASVKEEDICL